MTSAITNTFRSLLLDQLKEDIDGNSENYYIGLARADLITNPTIENSVYAQNQVRHSLQAVKALNNASHVIKNVTWSTGFAYEAYNDAISAQENFYVINSSKEVFLCIEQGKNAEGIVQNSVNEPFASHERSVENGGGLASDGKTFILEDLYKWRYLFTLSNLAYATYKTNQWIPVKKALAVATIAEEIEQYALQQASVDGEILSVEIVSGGSGYSATPDLTIGGDGTLADFEVTINNGSVVKVEVSQSALDASFQHGTGYRRATATLSAGNAVLRPIISPPKGTHDDPTKILKSVALMLQADFKSDEDAKITKPIAGAALHAAAVTATVRTNARGRKKSPQHSTRKRTRPGRSRRYDASHEVRPHATRKRFRGRRRKGEEARSLPVRRARNGCCCWGIRDARPRDAERELRPRQALRSARAAERIRRSERRSPRADREHGGRAAEG